MRNIEHQLASLRALRRRAQARVVSGPPQRLQPERLILRICDADLPGCLGEGPELGPARWSKLIVEAVEWLGPVPVTLLAWRRAGTPLAAELIRFSHRLECPTELWTDGSGIDLDKARELCDRGLGRVRLLVGGVSPEVHRAVVGGLHEDAVQALRALVQARAERGAALDIEIGLPWIDPAQTELRALVGWAREAGADGLRLLPPWRAEGLPRDPELLDGIEAMALDFDRTHRAAREEMHVMSAHADGLPGMERARAPRRRRRMRCPVGGQRLEIGARGTLRSCPFHPPIAQDLGEDGVELRAAWGRAQAHLEAIARCDRACAHVELAPRPILGAVGDP